MKKSCEVVRKAQLCALGGPAQKRSCDPAVGGTVPCRRRPAGDSRPMGGLARAWCIGDWRRMARGRLPRAIFDFFDGGAEDETTLAANRAAFARVRFAPKVLVDVSGVDTAAEILRRPAGLPIVVAPTGASC